MHIRTHALHTHTHTHAHTHTHTHTNMLDTQCKSGQDFLWSQLGCSSQAGISKLRRLLSLLMALAKVDHLQSCPVKFGRCGVNTGSDVTP